MRPSVPAVCNSTSRKEGAHADVATDVRRVREPEASVPEEASEAEEVKKEDHAVIA